MSVSLYCLCCMRLNKLDRPFGYQMSLRDCRYRCGCIRHDFVDGGPQSTISDATMIYVGYPYGRVRCVGKRHQMSVYTVELYAGDDNINIAGDDTEQLTPEGLWTIGTCSCGRINSDKSRKIITSDGVSPPSFRPSDILSFWSINFVIDT